MEGQPFELPRLKNSLKNFKKMLALFWGKWLTHNIESTKFSNG